MWKLDKEGNLENMRQRLLYCPHCDIFQTIVTTYNTKRVGSSGVGTLRALRVGSSRVQSSRVRSSRVRLLSIWSRVWQIFSDTNIFLDVCSYQFIKRIWSPNSRKRFFLLLNFELLTGEYFQSRQTYPALNIFGYSFVSNFWIRIYIQIFVHCPNILIQIYFRTVYCRVALL